MESLLFWNDVLHGKHYPEIGKSLHDYGITIMSSEALLMEYMRMKYNNSECAFCKGSGTRRDDFGYYYCLCWLFRRRYGSPERNVIGFDEANDDWASHWSPRHLKNMSHDVVDIKLPPKERKEEQEKFEETFRFVSNWIERPDKWLVISGKTGTGKTYMLNAMMRAWYPWAMYVVASDLEEKLFSFMKSDNEKIQKMLIAMKHHPILIIDDLGLEYGSKWIASQIDSIIQFRGRANRYFDFITVVSTNFPFKMAKEIWQRNGIPRTGSRLTDIKIVRWLAMAGKDWRQEKR